MAGNVWDWCSDWWSDNYNSMKNGASDPAGPSEGKYRVVRGGSWRAIPSTLRAVFRLNLSPMDRDHYIGFRLVLPEDP